MAFKPTPEQEEVIKSRNCNLLVAAAAGSGKTTVLVNRIMKLVTDETNPMDIDELLICTFTNAAASEMRTRIRRALDDLVIENPDDTHLERQSALVANAMITTIDGFCLNFLREHFYLLPYEPTFRIMDNGEDELLNKEILEEVLNEYYEEAEDDFINVIESYCESKDDTKLVEHIMAIYKCAMAYPWPEKWLDMAENAYSDSITSINDIPYFNIYEENASVVLTNAKSQMEQAIELSSYEEKLAKYNAFYIKIDEMLDKIIEADAFVEKRKAFLNFNPGTTPQLRNAEEEIKAIKEEADKYRKNVVEDIKALSTYYTKSEEEIINEHLFLKNSIHVLVDITRKYIARLKEIKIEKNIMNFSDVEHYTLDILYDEDGNRSNVAKEYSKRFREIMIDEYQDSSYLQEYILSAVSTCEEGKNNVFMVGDVKQSIYRFRQAVPDLFNNKYNEYTKEISDNRKIILGQNFRSRKEVVDFSNLVFESSMSADFGGIEYDEDASLKQKAEFKEAPVGMNNSEVLIIDEEAAKENGEDKIIIEAEVIARKIKQLMTKQLVAEDRDTLRPLKYSDIVILSRTKKEFTKIIETLRKNHIPAYSAESDGYYETQEISVMMSMLAIIDNERQDIPLTTVLCSPIGGLTKEELAQISTIREYKEFYLKVRRYLEEGENSVLKDKLKNFYSLLMELKKDSRIISLHELISEIYEKTGYYIYSSLMNQGELRRRNLDMFISKAKEYENTNFKGLSEFLRYIEQIKEDDVSVARATSMDAGDSVRLMTIHKSKGLEFPVVFVSQLGKKFNLIDETRDIIIDSDYGIGLKYADANRRVKGESLSHESLKIRSRKAYFAEEIRVLYVALTRAKEKLILTGFYKKTDELEEKQRSVLDKCNRIPYPAKVSAKCLYDFILPSLYRDDARRKADFDIQIINQLNEELPEEIIVEKKPIQKLVEDVINKDCADIGRLDIYNKEYHHENDLSIKVKMSVSEIKHHFMEQVLDEELDDRPEFLVEEKVAPIPEFVGNTIEENFGAIRGTATHRIMELLDFGEDWILAPTMDGLVKRIESMVNEGFIKEEDARLVNPDKVLKFLNSEIIKDIHDAQISGKLYKEQPFVMGIEPELAGVEIKSDELILVQGIIDLFYEKDNEIVLVDYKTDRVNSKEQLVKRYQKQMELYKIAIERTFQKKVSRIVLYSFGLTSVIDLI